MSPKLKNNLYNTYQSLPSIFFAAQNPEPSGSPECVLYNSELAKTLWITEVISPKNAHDVLSWNVLIEWSKPIAQAYAGHQFGHPTMLGDGRAVLLWEWETSDKKLFDIVLKGSGRTPFSRGWDGRATVKSMLREYLISESMHALWIPSSRSLAVVKTWNDVYREVTQEWAVLTRVMSSHIRVWTFEYAKRFGTKDDMKSLIDYTISRHYPELQTLQNPTLWLLEKVIDQQLNLITQWLRVGFIHGIMNTDNTSISGETFDYGPCAFMNAFHNNRAFSSIDVNERYAFGNQANMILWNLSIFASTLTDFIDEEIINQVLGTMGEHMHSKWLIMMSHKLWISNPISRDEPLIKELLSWMQDNAADYSNTFLYISWDQNIPDISLFENERFASWLDIWKQRVSSQEWWLLKAQENMKKYNPIYIPRNHIVEEVLDSTELWNYEDFHNFLEILKTPYTRQGVSLEYIQSPDGFDEKYETFCGT